MARRGSRGTVNHAPRCAPFAAVGVFCCCTWPVEFQSACANCRRRNWLYRPLVSDERIPVRGKGAAQACVWPSGQDLSFTAGAKVSKEQGRFDEWCDRPCTPRCAAPRLPC
ncbi:hypothetical protein E2C01_075702 [Portunus trituberculatus]|uniref:Uncharacterized protein n=1 Tax=Portunus trituberculatus TaxID=210409 RepID=A0A5B7I6R8_PORTR|nr:hypothetical protein [Portunus trituberculatus]